MSKRRSDGGSAPTDWSADDPLHTDFGWALGVLTRAYVKQANDAIGSLPGGPRGYQVLAASTRRPPMTQTAIAAETGIDRTVMTYLLDDLEKAGLLTRTADPDDRRSRLVVATEFGLGELARFDSALTDVQDRMLAVLDPDGREALRTLLRQTAVYLDGLEVSLGMPS